MVEVLVVAGVIAAAVLYTGRRVWLMAKGKSQGCSKCGGEKHCS